MKKKVLITFPAWFPNQQLLMESIQRKLNRSEIHHLVFSPKEKERPWDIDDSREVVSEVLPGISLTLFEERYLNLNFPVSKRLSAISPDLVIIGTWTDPACFMVKRFAQKRGIPTIAWVAGINGREPVGVIGKARKRISLFLARTFIKNHLFVFARGTQSRADAIKLGAPEDRCIIVKHTINEEHFDREKMFFPEESKAVARQKAGLDDRFVFLCISRLVSRKKIDNLFAASQKLAQVRKDFQVLLIGDGPLHNVIGSFVKQDSNFFRWLPKVDYKDIPLYYFLSDCFVFPTSYEDWGNVINESHCAKLPLITSDGPHAAVDLVRHRQTGLVYKVGDTDALVGFMQYAIDNPGHMKQLAENGYALIKKTWNTKCAAEIWCKYIKIALGEC
jgi:glycosyltransferase involved in cell wall biosynthesis